MRQFLALSQVQLRGMFRSLRFNSPAATIGIALGIACLVLLAAVYLGTLGFQLAALGLASVIPPLAVLMGSLSGVAFTFVKANGVLFGASDYESVMSLPVPTRLIVLSRMGAMLVYAVGIAALAMLPLYVGYFSAVPMTPMALAAALASIVLAPLAPTCLAAFAAFAVAAVASRFRHASIASILLTLVVVAVVMVLGVGKSFVMERQGIGTDELMLMMADLAGTLRTGLEAAYPPAGWLSAAMADGSLLGFVGFAAWSLVVPALAIELMARFYMRINSALAVRAAAGSVDGRQLERDASPFRALVAKELRTLANIPVYAMNTLVGPLLMLLATGAICVLGVQEAVSALGASDKDLAFLLDGRVATSIELLLPWMLAFCATLATPASVATSLEGRSAWIMMTLPVSSRSILGSKLAASFVVSGVPAAACAAALLASGQVGAIGAIEAVAVPLAALAFVASLGLSIDAANPNYGWISPTEVVKRGAPVLVTVLASFLVTWGGGAVVTALALNVGATAAHGFALALCAACCTAGALIFRRSCTRFRG